MPRGIYKRTVEHNKKISDAKKGGVHTEEHKRKISESLKGLKRNPFSKEHKGKISTSLKGFKHTEESKKNMSESGKRKIFTKEHRENISKNRKGIYHTQKTKKKISESLKGSRLSKETKRKISKAHKENWKDNKYAKAHAAFIPKYTKQSPNKLERRLRSGLNKMFPGEYKFVGTGKVWIAGKNPDFINVNGQKKIIELFGDYWHSKKKTGVRKKKHRKQRQKHFAEYGYETLVIWGHELKNISKLKRKLLTFQTGKVIEI